MLNYKKNPPPRFFLTETSFYLTTEAHRKKADHISSPDA